MTDTAKPKNALAMQTVDDRFETAKRRNNYLRADPTEKARPEGWKVKARPIGGLKNLTQGFQGAKVTATKDF